MLAGMAILIGMGGAFAAWALVKLIALVANAVWFGRLDAHTTSLAHIARTPWTVLAPVVGGLAIGLMARFGSEKIRGHGIPEAIEAILIGGSRMSPKVAVLKPISSAISIGTGGPFGAEGPIIMTGGAIGSLFAQFFHLSAAERKTLLVAGAAAGMTAIFGTPVAAVLLAVELLLFEWRPRSFISRRRRRDHRHMLATTAVWTRPAVSVRQRSDPALVGADRLRGTGRGRRPAVRAPDAGALCIGRRV